LAAKTAGKETDLHQAAAPATASAGMGKFDDDWAEDDQNRVSQRILDRCSVEIDQYTPVDFGSE
jgi:hypothetical protein